MSDLATLKRSVADFARAIGWPLAPWQAAAAALETRITTIMAGRQLGKSRLLAVLSLWWAFRRRDQHVLIVSASDHAARRVLALAASMARSSDLLADSVTDEQRGLLKLTNGSVVRSVAASESAVRGWTVDLALADECALLPDELVIDALLPTTAARREARVVLASSATRASGAFYDLHRAGELGDENVSAHKWVARAADGPDDAPWISPTAIAVDRAAMSPARFAAEHQAQPAGGASALFSPQAIARMFRFDYQPDELATARGPGRVTWGQDWGYSADRSAGVALGRIPAPGGKRLFAVRAWRRWDAGVLLPDVVREVAASPAHFQCVSAETNGLGGPAAQMLSEALEARPWSEGGGRRKQPSLAVVLEGGWDPTEEAPREIRRRRFAGFVTERRPVTTSAQSKAATWSAIRIAVDRGELIAPAGATDLRRELSLLEIALTQGGSEKIEASVGNDDLCDALYLACVPFKHRNGDWTCALAQLTDPRRALPEAEVPPEVLAAPHVSDGEVSIPVRPVWQSITRADLTVPEQLDLA